MLIRTVVVITIIVLVLDRSTIKPKLIFTISVVVLGAVVQILLLTLIISKLSFLGASQV